MGNRLLKESIRFNRRIDELDWFEEVMFYRLITAADDYGGFFADPVVLARILFPLKKGVDDRMTAKALKKLEAVGLVRCYRARGEEWLMIVSWRKHQRLRNSRHIFYGIPFIEQWRRYGVWRLFLIFALPVVVAALWGSWFIGRHFARLAATKEEVRQD